MRTLSVLLVLSATASSAFADATARFEVLDRGDAVEIIAHDVKAAKTAITPVRSRLEIPLVGTTSIPKLVPPTDKTIKIVELDGHAQQVLSVKLDFERPQVQQLAKHAQATQVGNDLHLIVPRAVPAAGATVSLPDPTLPPELAAKAAAIAPVPTTSSEIMAPQPPVAEAPKAEPAPAKTEGAPLAATSDKPDAKPDAKTAAPIAGTADATADKKAPIGKAADGSPMKNFPMLLACILALLGCIVWVKRRKNASPQKQASTIEVIAQKSLGGKAKIVWLQAGGREMIVSVTQQQVRMLGQWKKSETAARAASRDLARHDERDDVQAPAISRTVSRPIRAEGSVRTALPQADKAEKPASSAVAGILKLRARTNVPEINEDIATDDIEADEVWAREILAATGARK